ncbi:Odorant receptor 361 [Nylanderia fulva]|uniref:Odorant receptor n=1 Tax=Nylanderia fulva TaxID=613905 RepID=A0A6G1LPP9_9HYME|nr:Odorant receptor 361 [Nylanderia fulva]
MISVEDQYFSLNRTLLLAIGLWPYQKSMLARFQSICFFTIQATFIISQLTIFLTSKYTIDIVIKILSPAMACVSSTLTYNSFYVNGETIMYLMEQLQHIYEHIKDKNELVIIERYGNNAKHYTIAFLTLFFVILPIYLSAHIWPGFFDIILLTILNKPQLRHLQITTNYSVNQEQYLYIRQLHMVVALFIGIVAMIATGAMLITYIQHACGMFKIASLIHKNIICAVDIHRKAMKFSNHLISKLEMSFLLLIIFGVITLSCNIFQIFQVTSEYNCDQFLGSVIIVFVAFAYMFISNFIGQEIIDYNNDVYAAAYNVCWYTAPLHIQKIILFLLQRGNKPFGLNVAGLFIASLECFATLVKASVSYFTVMYSV